MAMKTATACRHLISLLAIGSLAVSGCGGDAGPASTPTATAETPTSSTERLPEHATAPTDSEGQLPDATESQTGSTRVDSTKADPPETAGPIDDDPPAPDPQSTKDPSAEAPGTVPFVDDPPDPATAPDQPDDSSRAGAEPGAQVNLEPRLAFYSDMDRDSEIVVWNIGGTGERLLTDNFDEELHPAWSPDGTRVAFVSDRAGSYDISSWMRTGPIRCRSPTTTSARAVRRGHPTAPASPMCASDTTASIATDTGSTTSYGEAYDDSDYDIFVTDADGGRHGLCLPLRLPGAGTGVVAGQHPHRLHARHRSR